MNSLRRSEKPIAHPKDKILGLINAATTTAISCHINPDGDAVGSVLALNEILRNAGKKTYLIGQKNLSRRYSFLYGWNSLIEKRAQPAAVDLLVCLDAGDAGRLPKPARTIIAHGTAVVNIDHHASNPGFGTASWIDPGAASTTVLIYELFYGSSYEFDKESAEALYVGLLTDTGGFTYRNTDARAFAVASELVKLGADPVFIDHNLNDGADINRFRIVGAILNTMAKAGRGEIVYIYASKEMLDEAEADASETEGVVEYTRRVGGARVGVFFRETDHGEVQVSFRSDSSVNVRFLAESFGGGGHNEAAGCKIKGPLEKAISTVLGRCEIWLEEKG